METVCQYMCAARKLSLGFYGIAFHIMPLALNQLKGFYFIFDFCNLFCFRLAVCIGGLQWTICNDEQRCARSNDQKRGWGVYSTLFFVYKIPKRRAVLPLPTTCEFEIC